ncbi:PAS domain-containing protein [Tepidicaulis sp.]|uniref:PAS domain-containing protein n=1 Tax=Tepidicaulis sp. TaxID=1920809 RepID=UPI003B5BD1ED
MPTSDNSAPGGPITNRPTSEATTSSLLELPVARHAPGHPLFSTLYALWTSLEGTPPAWHRFDPQSAAGTMAHAFIFQFEPETGRYCIPFMGAELQRLIGEDFSNHYLDEIFPVGNLAGTIMRLEQCRKTGEAFLIQKKTSWAEEQQIVFNSLFLPFTDEKGAVTTVLAAVDFGNPIVPCAYEPAPAYGSSSLSQ